MYYYNNNLPPQQGWICPKCGRVNAPWVSTCGCISSQTTGDSIIKYANTTKMYCACTGKWCEFANLQGFCTVTACRKRVIDDDHTTIIKDSKDSTACDNIDSNNSIINKV